uniref:Uncharacterized protein n=2 Tax=Corethron hystrix TaxID=216773 RepID=A0A6U5KAD7_9STRA|mmetsp:Transcript_39968/g.93815  ORF Transcript_39968/g.93815 Transcript_39968/m.93815 type:complete len:576 (+) Transcript_39968:679-2406(+)|eukprot:CAMPEP_0113304320 /NCGR_PEP_ID=MMETSP0010_2-20120614/4392_1 /TAXON_ID=216773 ORGANISM="Corethron hystrix, Strain 308" /NCGR_SAMPLE_ID=MMETSP0010_2 /ASSEMBLY_ACC=CAM_ASM_000155 /LENGTH=575 /DNA_ID=CAMNT_0000158511 /DNA_START=522 /DNA_END=2249 /DNA_ORIENTATION=+ /assembly_acc=CAM_ASM_000155
MSVPITTEVILVSKVNNAEVSTDKIKVESVPVVAEAALDATDSDHADESRRQPSDEVDMIVGFPVSSQKNKSTGAEAEEFNMEVETQNEAKKEEIIKDGNHVYETPKASSSAVVDVAGWGDKSLVDDTSDEEEDIPQNPIPVKEESTDLDETMNGSEAQEKAQEEAEEFKKIQEESVTPEVMSALRKLGVNEARNHPLFKFSDSSKSLQGSTSPSDYLPMIKQKSSKSFMESADKISRNKLGLTVDISSRNVMETQLRKSMYEFEEKMSTFRESLENGADTVIWQLESRISTAGEDEGDQFIIQNSHVTMKLVKRGEGLIMSVLTFTKGKGVFGNLMGKTDNFISDPLLIREILEIKAGCAGYTSAFLPTNSKARSKDNKNSSLFLTIKATSTPVASSRSYFIKLKTTEDRNTFLSGLRKVMADLQIEESMKSLAKPRPILKKKGSLGLSTLKSNAPDETDDEDDESTTVSLTDVKQLIIKERSNYERLLILLMQGQEDMLDKEESIIEMREAMDIMANAETEKAKIQANDSKLIMQLSKKLEGLLINLEDMKETNERLNLRLIEFECEKMNKYI